MTPPDGFVQVDGAVADPGGPTVRDEVPTGYERHETSLGLGLQTSPSSLNSPSPGCDLCEYPLRWEGGRSEEGGGGRPSVWDQDCVGGAETPQGTGSCRRRRGRVVEE